MARVRAMMRSEGGCYLLALILMGVGVALIYALGESPLNVLSLPFILGAIFFLFKGMWIKLVGRTRNAVRSARELPGRIRDIQETARRERTEPDDDAQS